MSSERLERLKAEWEASRLRRLEWEQNFARLMDLRREAFDLEDSGQLDLAAEKYESAVSFGLSCKLNPSDYYGCWDRLMKIYRKLKRYADEDRVISANLASYHERLSKIPGFANKIKKLEERLAKCRALAKK